MPLGVLHAAFKPVYEFPIDPMYAAPPGDAIGEPEYICIAA